jgi:hypothetical protein
MVYELTCRQKEYKHGQEKLVLSHSLKAENPFLQTPGVGQGVSQRAILLEYNTQLYSIGSPSDV